MVGFTCRRFCPLLIHLPTSLCSTRITALPSSYGGSDSRPPFSHAEGYPRFTTPECVLSFCVQPPCAFLIRASHSLFPRSGTFPWTRPFQPAPMGYSASPFTRRLAKTQSRIDFLLVRTDRLAFRCFPPRLPANAVTVGFQPVERLVESISTSSSGALSGARAVAASATDPWHGRGSACARRSRHACGGTCASDQATAPTAAHRRRAAHVECGRVA